MLTPKLGMSIALAMLLSLGSVNATFGLIWRHEIVSLEAHGLGFHPGFAVTPDGRVFAAWDDSGNVFVAQRVAGVWLPPTTVSDHGDSANLASDPNGGLHLVYRERVGRDLAYARLEGDTWIHELIDADGDIGTFPMVAAGADGRVHVVYSGLAPFEQRYAVRENGSWTSELLSADGLGSSSHGVAVGPDGRAHVAYLAFSNPSIVRTMYAKELPDGTWTREVAGYCGFPSLAVDAIGAPHIACNDDGPHLYYFQRTSSGWQQEIIDNGYVARESSIAIDSQGRPHIGHGQKTCSPEPLCGHLRYSTKLVDGSWYHTFVDPEGFMLDGPTLRLDPLGVPRLLYYYYRDQVPSLTLLSRDLRYAEPVLAPPGGMPTLPT